MDPTVRETYSDQGFFNEVLNNIKSRIPGYSKDLPPRRNLWGEPITWEGALGSDWLSPVQVSKEKRSPIDNEMVRLKMEVAMPAKIQSFEREALDLTPKEYDRYIQLMNKTELASTGMTLKRSLDQLVTRDPEYKAANDDRKEVMIKRHILQAKDLARQALLEETPALRSVLDQVHHERMMRETGMSRTTKAGAAPHF